MLDDLRVVLRGGGGGDGDGDDGCSGGVWC